MGEEDVVEVMRLGETRGDASRSGRVILQPRRLEQESSQAAHPKQGRTTVTSKKTTHEVIENPNTAGPDVSDQLRAALQLLHAQGKNARDQAEHVNKYLDQQVKQITQLDTTLNEYIQGNKAELAAIRSLQDQFSARLEVVENWLVELREQFGQLRNDVTISHKEYIR
jgi:ABC-type transporter Mla subunit MlaD